MNTKKRYLFGIKRERAKIQFKDILLDMIQEERNKRNCRSARLRFLRRLLKLLEGRNYRELKEYMFSITRKCDANALLTWEGKTGRERKQRRKMFEELKGLVSMLSGYA